VKGEQARGYKNGLQPETLADGNWLVNRHNVVCDTAALNKTIRLINQASGTADRIKSKKGIIYLFWAQ
jgi:hypothetical protein